MPPIPDEVLPKGVACPHCASIGTGQPLRLLDSHNTEEARSYLDSPGAAATLTLAVAVAVAVALTLALTLALALALALALTLALTLTLALSLTLSRQLPLLHHAARRASQPNVQGRRERAW